MSIRDKVVQKRKSKPTREAFSISEQMIQSYAEEILMWGQSKRLSPPELGLVLMLMKDFIFKKCGIENVDIQTVDQ